MESPGCLVPMTAMVFVLWCVGILPKSVNGENATLCTQTSTCSCEFPDGVIDFSPIVRQDNQSTFKDIPQGDSNMYFYSWNPCYPFNQPGMFSTCYNVATCQMINQSTGASNHALGTQASAVFKKIDGKIVIVYNYTSFLRKRTSTIYLECDEDLSPGTLTIPTALSVVRNYNMYYKGLYACIRSESGSGLSTGSIILIVLFGVVCVYLIFGIPFQVVYKKESGRKIIPNSSCWFALAGLTKGGFLFIIQACACRGKKYDSI